MSKFTWSTEFETKLTALVAGQDVVSQETLQEIAEGFALESGKEVTKRQIGSKLRKMEVEVEKAGVKARSWTDEEAAALAAFVQANAHTMTYAELAAAFNGGSHTTRQVQGKILSLELTSLVKPTEKKAAVKSYSEAEEATIVQMAANGAFLEDIAAALGKELNSIRGKALSMSRSIAGFLIPAQKVKAEARADALEGLDISEMTIAQVAEKVEKSERGVKSMLSRRGLSCADYDGAAKRAKLDGKAE